MIKLIIPLPKQITVAFSGGVDSVAAVDFLSRKHDVTCAFFHHGTENSERAFEFVAEYCTKNKLPLIFSYNNDCTVPKGISQEEHWRNKRYEFFKTLGTVITCHHLDDCVETYIWSAMHGTPKLIPLVRDNIIRPFLTTPKDEFIDWCNRRNLEWCHDHSNDDTKYMRNYIRKFLVPHALHVNPGLKKVVKKMIQGNRNS